MESPEQAESPVSKAGAGTLGQVLYSNAAKRLVSEEEWVALVRAVSAGEPHALHALYERSHRLVFTLAVRITHSHETAEEVTLDVFVDAWRRAPAYDPANGTVLGWIMNLARSRAIDRVRLEGRKKRVDPGTDEPTESAESLDPRAILELKQGNGAVRGAMAILSANEREAIELAFFAELTHAEVAARLNEPVGTVKTRIRSGLRKVRQALAGEKRQ